MRLLYTITSTIGTLLLALFCLPRYGIWTLLVILPVGLLLLLVGKALFATRVKKGHRAGDQTQPVSAQSTDGPVTTIEDVLATITTALKVGGGQAAEAKAESLRQQRVHCRDCGNTFVLNDGIALGRPPAHRVLSVTDRERMYGYTVECPACQKGGFVGKPIA